MTVFYGVPGPGGGSAVLEDADQLRVVNALVKYAESLERQARGRKWAGPAFAEVRASMRDAARAHRELAARLGNVFAPAEGRAR